MTLQCPSELFKQFEESLNGWVRPNDDGQQFLYDALGDHMEFAGVTPLVIPHLENETFSDWQKFEYWCEDLRLDLMWKIVDLEDVNFKVTFEKYTPKKHFRLRKV